jgi:signal transduction histidine kinase
VSLDIILLGNSASGSLASLQSGLEGLGYTLHTVGGVTDALTTARQIQPAAFLVDLSVPELNGIQACGLIKASNHTIPVIALLRSEPALQEAALLAGADQVMDYAVTASDVGAWLADYSQASNGLSPDTRIFMGRTRAEVMGTASLLGHDLKSPISMIISTLEVLVSIYENDESMANSVRLLRGALSAAYRQLNMIGDWLDLARLELEAYELEIEETDLGQLIRDCLDADDYAITTKKLRLEIDIPKDELFPVKADPELLRRVVSAMVDNSVKFTIRDDLFRVTVRKVGDNIVAEFSDNGRAIFPGFEAQVMERAPQWEARQAGTRTSVSMGLPFVHAVARAHGGTFTAKSDQATGLTTFAFTLPINVLSDKNG